MSSAEPQKKLSKKAKLKLARERAAQFAQRDKEKIENRRGKKIRYRWSKGKDSKQVGEI